MSNENNLTYHASTVSPEDRERLLGQQGRVLWFTGLSGSGKSTLANATEAVLHASGRATFLLDGDNVRLGLNRDLGFSADDRTENIRRIAEVAKLMADAGLGLTLFAAFVLAGAGLALFMASTRMGRSRRWSTPVSTYRYREERSWS